MLPNPAGRKGASWGSCRSTDKFQSRDGNRSTLGGHLGLITRHANEVAAYQRSADPNNQTKDFGAHGTGFSGQGSLSSGGAAGADSVGHCDSTGATGY